MFCFIILLSYIFNWNILVWGRYITAILGRWTMWLSQNVLLCLIDELFCCLRHTKYVDFILLLKHWSHCQSSYELKDKKTCDQLQRTVITDDLGFGRWAQTLTGNGNDQWIQIRQSIMCEYIYENQYSSSVTV